MANKRIGDHVGDYEDMVARLILQPLAERDNPISKDDYIYLGIAISSAMRGAKQAGRDEVNEAEGN
jgi:hypothetical protein